MIPETLMKSSKAIFNLEFEQFKHEIFKTIMQMCTGDILTPPLNDDCEKMFGAFCLRKEMYDGLKVENSSDLENVQAVMFDCMKGLLLALGVISGLTCISRSCRSDIYLGLTERFPKLFLSRTTISVLNKYGINLNQIGVRGALGELALRKPYSDVEVPKEIVRVIKSFLS